MDKSVIHRVPRGNARNGHVGRGAFFQAAYQPTETLFPSNFCKSKCYMSIHPLERMTNHLPPSIWKRISTGTPPARRQRRGRRWTRQHLAHPATRAPRVVESITSPELATLKATLGRAGYFRNQASFLSTGKANLLLHRRGEGVRDVPLWWH